MGQNSSQLGSSSPRRRISSPNRRKAPPTPAPPPKPPAYAVAENCVLPGGPADMAGARRLLRPVSQELTKFHPDFADIFGYDSEVDALPRGGDGGDREGGNISDLSFLANGEKPHSGVPNSTNQFTDVTPTKFQTSGPKPENGSATFMPGNSQNKPGPGEEGKENNKDLAFQGGLRDANPISNQPRTSGVSIRRTQSMEPRPRLQAGRDIQGKFHKRQMSVTPVIPEDPREHLYNVARAEPFSNAQPSSASLPLASSFGLDYSFNVTYAQLADFRRKQREDDMGTKMDELSAEIKASSTVPKSPFDRANIGEKSATRSVSTGSSETGVSKSKKKKAPAPPPPANVPPLTRQSQRDQSPSRLSMTTEPPADYDMGTEISPASSPPSRGRALHRSFSSAGEYEISGTPSRLAERNSGHEPSPNDASSSAPSAPPPPPPPPAPPLPDSFKNSAVSSSKMATTAKPVDSQQKTNNSLAASATKQSGIQKSIAEAKAQIEELKRLQDLLKNGDNTKPKKTPSPTENTMEKEAIEKVCEDKEISESTSSSELPKANTPTSTGVDEKKETGNAVKVSTPRLSSLLQHDIVIAAQARGAKIVKSKPPPALEKPKDMAELFREQLAKAAQAREERMSREGASDDIKNNNNNNTNKFENGDTKTKDTDPSFVFQSSFLKVSKKPPPTAAKPQSKIFTNNTGTFLNENAKTKSGGDTQETYNKMREDIWIPEIEDRDERDSSLVSKRSSIQSEDMSISSSNASQRIFPPTWTPEDDLDSDDDMNEAVPPFTHVFAPPRHVMPNSGFKSSVLPTKIDSLKKDESKKKKEKKEKERTNKEELSSPRQRVPEEVKKSQVMNNEDGQNLSSSDKDEKKFGNLRKLQKGVKNAFGSISKASGKLLKRRKSQEILDIPGDMSSLAEQHSEVSMNPNWSLGETSSGSLRRVASEGHMPVQTIYHNGVANGHKSEDDDDDDDSSSSGSSSESDDSGDDVGDIDFAEGINDIPKSKKRGGRKTKTKTKSKTDKVQAMTRAGVAYVSPDGQIFVLPEESTDKRSTKKGLGKNNAEKKHRKSDSGGGFGILPTPRFFEKSSKKLSFASSLERHGKDKVVEVTGHRGQDADLRRLQELEAQERLHRLETAKMQEQITRLQRQQLERSHADLSSNGADQGEQFGVNASDRSISANHAAFYNDGKAQYYNGGEFLYGQHRQDNTAGFGFDPAFNRYSAPSLSSNPTPLIARNLSPRLATTSDLANYTVHSAPLVGGASNGSSALGYPASSASSYSLSNFTPQELAYLSEYMRVMGVTPPSSQQQWAALLNSLNFPSTNNNTNTNNIINALSNRNTNNFNHLVQNNHVAPGVSETMLYTNPVQGNHVNHSIATTPLLGEGPNLLHVVGGAKTIEATSSVTAENHLLNIRPAPTMAANGPNYPTHPTPPQTVSTDSSGEFSITSDNSSALRHSIGITNLAPTQTNPAMNTHNMGNGDIQPGDRSTNMPGNTSVQSGQTGVPGREPVRSLSTSGVTPASGVYGPMGYRQIST